MTRGRPCRLARLRTPQCVSAASPSLTHKHRERRGAPRRSKEAGAVLVLAGTHCLSTVERVTARSRAQRARSANEFNVARPLRSVTGGKNSAESLFSARCASGAAVARGPSSPPDTTRAGHAVSARRPLLRK